MLFDLPPDDTLYEALLSRDARFDGQAYVGVTSTGIFCCLTCPARKPKRENCRFFDTVAGCLSSGFRPCKRCRPLAPAAVRAVARANGANQIALIIPCHRVIGADGSLTGYGGGLWRKQRLIELERHYAKRISA